MRSRRYAGTLRALVLGLSVVLVLAACGGDDDGDAEEPEPAAEAEAEEPEAEEAEEPEAEEEAEEPEEEPAEDEPAEAGVELTVTTAESEFGEILVDQDGYVLYGFTNDEGGVSSCYDDCEDNWPPLTGDVAAEGLDEALLGTTERDDGTTQITYNDWPLYYFAGDEMPGDVEGQAVGDVWWVITPAGELVM